MMEIELLQNIIPNYKPNTLRNTKPSRVDDPGAHPAQLMAIRATDKAIEKNQREDTLLGGYRLDEDPTINAEKATKSGIFLLDRRYRGANF